MNAKGFHRKLQTELGSKAQVLGVRIEMNPARTGQVIKMMLRCRGETEPVLFRKVVMNGVSLMGIPAACANEISTLRNLTDEPLEKVNLQPEVRT